MVFFPINLNKSNYYIPLTSLESDLLLSTSIYDTFSLGVPYRPFSFWRRHIDNVFFSAHKANLLGVLTLSSFGVFVALFSYHSVSSHFRLASRALYLHLASQCPFLTSYRGNAWLSTSPSMMS